jgi:hypothetical protein
VSVAPEQADLLSGSWRRWQQAFDAYDSGDEAETFQAVGVRLRECLVSFIGSPIPEPEVPAGGMMLQLARNGGCGMKAQLQTALREEPPRLRPVSAGAAASEHDGGATARTLAQGTRTASYYGATMSREPRTLEHQDFGRPSEELGSLQETVSWMSRISHFWKALRSFSTQHSLRLRPSFHT